MKTLLLITLSLGLMMCKSASVTPIASQSPALSSLKEYLIFGNVAIGWGCRSSQMYMLADGKLYADTLNTYCAAFKAQKTYVFSGYQLPDSEYQKAKNMLSALPTGFFTSSQKTFGCPGCADGGMLFLAYKKEGLIENDWTIDDAVYWRSTDTVNKAFPPFVDTYGKVAYQTLQVLKTK